MLYLDIDTVLSEKFFVPPLSNSAENAAEKSSSSVDFIGKKDVELVNERQSICCDVEFAKDDDQMSAIPKNPEKSYDTTFKTTSNGGRGKWL